MTEQPSDLLPSPVLSAICECFSAACRARLMGEVIEQPFPLMLPAHAEIWSASSQAQRAALPSATALFAGSMVPGWFVTCGAHNDIDVSVCSGRKVLSTLLCAKNFAFCQHHILLVVSLRLCCNSSSLYHAPRKL